MKLFSIRSWLQWGCEVCVCSMLTTSTSKRPFYCSNLISWTFCRGMPQCHVLLFKEGSFIANNTIIINIFCNHDGLHQTSNDFLGVAFSGLREELFPIVSALWGHYEVSLCHDMHLTLPRRLTCSIFLWPASKTVVPDFFPSGYSGLYHQPPIWQGFFALLRLLRKFQYENLLWSDSDIRTQINYQ